MLDIDPIFDFETASAGATKFSVTRTIHQQLIVAIVNGDSKTRRYDDRRIDAIQTDRRRRRRRFVDLFFDGQRPFQTGATGYRKFAASTTFAQRRDRPEIGRKYETFRVIDFRRHGNETKKRF